VSALQWAPVAQAALSAWQGVERGVFAGRVVVRQVMAMRRGSTAGRVDPLMTGFDPKATCAGRSRSCLEVTPATSAVLVLV
jgi:hypothetical protein